MDDEPDAGRCPPFADPRRRGFRTRSPVEEVVALIDERTGRLGGEELPLGEAAGRVLAVGVRPRSRCHRSTGRRWTGLRSGARRRSGPIPSPRPSSASSADRVPAWVSGRRRPRPGRRDRHRGTPSRRCRCRGARRGRQGRRRSPPCLRGHSSRQACRATRRGRRGRHRGPGRRQGAPPPGSRGARAPWEARPSPSSAVRSSSFSSPVTNCSRPERRRAAIGSPT